MATAGLLAKLSEIQEQQTTSSSHIQLLRDQHREWQRSVDELLADIRSQAEGAPLVPAPPAVQEAREKQKDTDPASNEDNEEGNDEPNRASISFSRRSMSTESLLRSRNTVAQNFPAGPLRKLVTEVLNDSKAAPKELSWLGRLRAKAAGIVQSSWFEFGAGVIILLNLVTIGIEAQLSLHSGETYTGNFWPGGVERIFLAIYSVEALLRLVAGGLMIFLDLWFLLDVALVIVGLLALLIVPAVAGNSGDIDGFERLLVVRGLRLFRLVRAWRMLRHFKIVWRLIYGLMNAGQTIISTTMLIMVSLFIFACVAVEVIAKDEYLARAEATAEIVEKQFFGLNRAMVTLMQFVTLDNLSDVYYPLIMTRPWLCLYFFPILVFISIGLMNLVTAALVENAMQTAAHEAEEERLKLKKRVRGALPSLIEIFHALDTDRSGLLTHEEVVNVPLDVLPPRVLDAIYVESMADIFDYLDVDGTGQLSQMEFVEGLLNLCLMDMPISTIQSLKLLQLIRGLLGKVDQDITSLKAHVQAIGQEVLSKLSEVLEQQQTSSTNLKILQNQLREWRLSVDALLGIHSQTSGAPRGPLQHQAPAVPATSKTRASVQIHFRTPEIARAFGSDADSDMITDSVMLNETAARRTGPIGDIMELPSPIDDSDGVGHRKSLSSQSLLQPRKSVVQNLPTGPLRKLVSEVLHDAEVTTQKLSRIEAFRQTVGAIVNSSLFEFVAGIIILLNLIFIGIEAQVSLQTGEVYAENFWPGGVERIFLVLYTIEAALRVTGLGCAAFKDLWFLMDLTLMMIGALALEIVPRVSGGRERRPKASTQCWWCEAFVCSG
ncbi:CACNA1H [Symbiodinium sp. CCMP2456]|nr:CACNA1H [Symbiodinium sp. CCMP2456]